MDSSDEQKLIIKKIENLIVTNSLDEALDLARESYQYNPSIIEFLHLTIIAMILGRKSSDLVTFLNSEERISLYGSKLGYIKSYIRVSPEANLYQVGRELEKRNWSQDSKLYFKLHSILNPDHDLSLIPQAEEAIRERNFQKGMAIFSSASNNFFKRKEGDLRYE